MDNITATFYLTRLRGLQHRPGERWPTDGNLLPHTLARVATQHADSRQRKEKLLPHTLARVATLLSA